MLTNKGTVGISLYEGKNELIEEVTTKGGLTYFQDTKFDALYKVENTGYIVATNEGSEKEGLKKDTQIWFTHLVIGESTKDETFKSNGFMFNGTKVYLAETESQIIAYRGEDGGIYPFKDVIFTEQVKVDINKSLDTFLIIPDNADSLLKDIAKVSGFNRKFSGNVLFYDIDKKTYSNRPLEIGDYLKYEIDCDYDIEIEGVTHYAIRNEDILMGIKGDINKLYS